MFRILILLVLAGALGASETPSARPAPPTVTIALKGAWVLDADGKPIGPQGFRRGLQPSGLVYRDGQLWSIGDQRSEYPNHVFRIDPRTGRLIGKPIRLDPEPPAGAESADFQEYRAIPNCDFEGLAVVPGAKDRMLALTEDKTPWIADVRLEESAGSFQARLKQLTRITLPPGITSWRNDPNYRFEGLCVSDDAAMVYLAFERAEDELPRIYSTPLAEAVSGSAPRLVEVPVAFAAVPLRADKPKARLNVNDILFLRTDGRPSLLAVLRDQERVATIDLEKHEVTRIVDLQLLDPEGRAIEWVSPEGLAVDTASDRLWIINDPDSVGTNYRLRDRPAPEGPFAEYSALLFEVRLSEVLGVASGPRPTVQKTVQKGDTEDGGGTVQSGDGKTLRK